MDEDDIAAERRRAEAAQWFARLKTLPVSHGTLKDFFAWRRRGGNAEAFEEAERFWSEAVKVGERPSILRAVQEAAGRGSKRRRFGTVARPLTVLAVCLAVILISIVGMRLFAHQGDSFRTMAGEQRAVALDDGSRVNLHTQTAVNVRYTRTARQLVLESGEALFSVAKDTARPFTVKAGDVTVTATGTRFDVAMRDNRVFVTLVDGQVRVRAPDGSTQALLPGDQWRWPADGLPVRTIKTQTVTAWTQGRIVFDDTTLADAVAEINRYGGKPVVLSAPQFGSRRISGSFEAGDPNSFATAVTAFLSLQRTTDGQGRIHLTPRDQSAK
ncbi:FecR family protein [Sphingobium aquiterrae]|uniref:FecR family protein n=1 Tax=Sphingobium aquiterrae TaxID=2038656 RepID=UPI00301A6805|tara:strand:+ start:4630 stop:5613 length:984 start_codon:yes stop_codon:yes gene_type:complete